MYIPEARSCIQPFVVFTKAPLLCTNLQTSMKSCCSLNRPMLTAVRAWIEPIMVKATVAGMFSATVKVEPLNERKSIAGGAEREK